MIVCVYAGYSICPMYAPICEYIHAICPMYAPICAYIHAICLMYAPICAYIHFDVPYVCTHMCIQWIHTFHIIIHSTVTHVCICIVQTIPYTCV